MDQMYILHVIIPIIPIIGAIHGLLNLRFCGWLILHMIKGKVKVAEEVVEVEVVGAL